MIDNIEIRTVLDSVAPMIRGMDKLAAMASF